MKQKYPQQHKMLLINSWPWSVATEYKFSSLKRVVSVSFYITVYNCNLIFRIECCLQVTNERRQTLAFRTLFSKDTFHVIFPYQRRIQPKNKVFCTGLIYRRSENLSYSTIKLYLPNIVSHYSFAKHVFYFLTGMFAIISYWSRDILMFILHEGPDSQLNQTV